MACNRISERVRLAKDAYTHKASEQSLMTVIVLMRRNAQRVDAPATKSTIKLDKRRKCGEDAPTTVEMASNIAIVVCRAAVHSISKA